MFHHSTSGFTNLMVAIVVDIANKSRSYSWSRSQQWVTCSCIHLCWVIFAAFILSLPTSVTGTNIVVAALSFQRQHDLLAEVCNQLQSTSWPLTKQYHGCGEHVKGFRNREAKGLKQLSAKSPQRLTRHLLHKGTLQAANMLAEVWRSRLLKPTQSSS